MAGLSDYEDKLHIRNAVALQQKKMSDALNCSLTKLCRLYSFHNNPPVPTNEVGPEPAAINADDEGWWTPISVNSKRRLDSRSVTKVIRNSNRLKKNVSANRFSELSNMDIVVEVSQPVSPNDSEKASTSTSNNNVVNTNVGNNPASNNKKHSQPSGSQGQLAPHKPPPIVADHCENLNGLIRCTDTIVDRPSTP